MALPNSVTYANDMAATAAWRTVNNNLHNFLTKEGEILLPELAARGRIFAVPDTLLMSDTFYYAAPGDATYRGVAPSTYGTGATLGQTSASFMSQMFWNHFEWQNNVPFPSTELSGNPVDVQMARVKAKRAEIFNREEALLLRGSTTIDGTITRNAPYSGDVGYDSTNYHPMSLASLYASGCTKGGSGGDLSANTFANVKGDDSTEWETTITATGNANGSTLLTEDFAKALASATYGAQSPNFCLTSLNVWTKINSLLVAYSALNQPASTDVVRNPAATRMVAGIPVVWSRYLADTSQVWDFTGNAQAEYPILLLNLNSLRMNVPAGGGLMGGEGLNFVRKISDIQAQELQTQHFYRIAAKRSYTLDNGRRSFGAIEGVTL